MTAQSSSPEPLAGHAVVGDVEAVVFPPCHRVPVRVDLAGLEPWLPVTVLCRRCPAVWTVRLPAQPCQPALMTRLS